jgi:hypothetical protein
MPFDGRDLISTPGDYAKLDIKALTDLLADRRVRLDDANEEVRARQEAYDGVEAALFDRLEDQGLTQVKTERGLFRMNELAWASVSDEEAARSWAENHMPELLLLNRQRLSVVVRRILKGEEQLPDGKAGELPPGVDFKTTRKITWRRQ